MLDFWCGFADIFILSCGITVLQNQAVCGFQKFSSNSTAVSGFLMLFCAVFTRISVRFCGIGTPLTPPSCSVLFGHHTPVDTHLEIFLSWSEFSEGQLSLF